MSDKSDLFFAEAKKIQANCCCHFFNERECYRSRYPRPIDDCFRETYQDEDDECECVCHVELAELERDIWPDDESVKP
jgi:hypothetical protein